MNIGFIDFLLLALASFRMTHLLVYDKIAAFIRAPFLEETKKVDENGNSEISFIPKGKGIINFIGKLLSCHWCTGVWSSAGIILIYYFFPQFAIPFVLVFAVAGFSAILELSVQFVQKK